jgi:carbon monoxide dehydrogenase subunit G
VELRNECAVALNIDKAWAVLTDIERIAPCMPGAVLEDSDGEEYRGVVKVKVGPITAQYRGKALFVERDDVGYRAVIRAEGRDTRGQGNASATITATLVEQGDGTGVTVVTDLAISGRAAQFGRGVLADVSTKLLGQFVSCLESDLLADSQPVENSEPRPTAPQAAQPVDLLDTVGVPSIVRWLVPALVAATVVGWLRRRRRLR